MFAFSSLPYDLIIHTGHIGAGNGLMGPLVMWCPGFAAFATCGLFKIDLATLGWNWRPARYQARAYVIPILYALPVCVYVWGTIRGSFAFSAFADPLATAFGFPDHPRAVALFLAIPGYATLSIIGRTPRPLGEEIGWRGFLFPRRVRQTGFTWACLINGCMWAVGHYPGLLFADCNAGTQPAFALTCFTLMVFAASFIWGCLRPKSGSPWSAAILHARHNIFIQIIFDGMTAPVGLTPGRSTSLPNSALGWY